MRKIIKLNDLKIKPKEYTKRPITIKAVELKEEVEIETREGTLKGYVGDFLIEGIEGEIYPCGREIFIKTYYPEYANEEEAKLFNLQLHKD